MKAASWVCLAVLFTAPLPSGAGTWPTPESRISVPVSIDLRGLSAFVDTRLRDHDPLHRDRYRRTCVEPQRVCTKVPEFRGFEMTMKNRCKNVSPKISCNVTETITREGPINISGRGGQVVIVQNVFGSGTVEGVGEIGQHIRQTVRARARMTIVASPRIAANWQPEVPISISYRWLERPEFRLFNLIPITIGSELGPPLKEALREFKRTGLDNELAKLDLKGEAARLWKAIQVPQELTRSGGETLFLHLRPYAVAFDGPNFDGEMMRARLDLALRAEVSDAASGPATVPLPNLSQLADAGLKLNVPFRVTTETLNAEVDALLPTTVPLGEDADGMRVQIHEAVTAVDGEALSIDLLVDAGGGPLSLNKEAIRIKTVPSLDAATGTLIFSDIRLASGDEGFVGRAKTLLLRAAGVFMDETYSIALNDELSSVEKTLNRALNRDLTPDFKLVGSGEMRAQSLTLLPEASALQATISSTGDVRVIGFDTRRAE